MCFGESSAMPGTRTLISKLQRKPFISCLVRLRGFQILPAVTFVFQTSVFDNRNVDVLLDMNCRFELK